MKASRFFRHNLRFSVVLLLFISFSCNQNSGVGNNKNLCDGQSSKKEYNSITLKPGPAEGETVSTNPAAFHWPADNEAKGFILEISRSSNFDECKSLLPKAIKNGGLTPESLTATPKIDGKDTYWLISGLSSPLYRPSFTMESGTWYWRFRSVSENNTVSEASIARKFYISPKSTPYTVAPTEQLLERIPSSHPRLFTRPEKLDSLRGLLKTSTPHKELYDKIIAYTNTLLTIPISKEPKKITSIKENEILSRQEWRAEYEVARKWGQILDFLGFSYMMSGDEKYAERAKQWLLTFASWDINGTSAMKSMDEVAMPILLNGARAYDWIYDYLNESERATIKEMLRVRGEEAFGVIQRLNYNYKPFISHPTRLINYMTQVGVVLHGEIKEADKWLGYVIPILTTFYPPWGGRDGGYSEGPSYWMMYFNYMLQSAYTLQTSMNLDILKTDFYKNDGYFKIYAYPYYGAMRPFADTGIGTYWPADKINLYRLATVFHNPYFRWRAEVSPPKSLPVAETIIPSGVVSYFWLDEGPNHVKPKAPTDLPKARLFSDVGLVAFHEDLGNPDEIYFLLKSSPFGAWSHTYADQNSFYIQGYGEALAIQSGYYPSHGCPHHRNWTWNSIAHNTVLVDGKGQKIRDRASKGKIIAFKMGNGEPGSVDYAAADATEAYEGLLTKFVRNVYYERPRDFLMIDELEAPKPVQFNWLLHSLNKMQIDTKKKTVIIRKGKAQLKLQFITPDELIFSQTNKFNVAPGPLPTKESVYPNQWHLTVSTKNKATAATFTVKMKVTKVK